MQKIYVLFILLAGLYTVWPAKLAAQTCTGITATATAYESRCAATGSIKVVVSGGSGSYSYKVTGNVNTNFTSTDSITGLSAGTYTVTVNDIVRNCTYSITNVVVPGTYSDPRFTLKSEDVSCDNGSNGSIKLNAQSFGRAPFQYAIVAPSPMGVGTSNSTGNFSNLRAGVYTIRLTDSCGGIQTRLVTINNYTWQIDSFYFWKASCDTARGYVRVSDSKGNISTITGLAGFSYGVVRNPGDTIWSANAQFAFYLAGQSTFEVVVKDPCGKVKKALVKVNFKSSIASSVRITNTTCSTFTASLSNVSNFTRPLFCLYDGVGTKLSCNGTGAFSNLPYGSYCINAYDSCSDTTIIRCFNVTAPPVSVGSDVNIFNKTCYSFSAAITGQMGLTNPTYCLYDASNTQLQCNNSGVFNNLSYGSYCITIKDNCRDTTITRCFNPRKPMPVLPAVLVPAYYTCTNFGVVVGGDSLTNPRYCIVDINGNTLTCNTTGIFDSLQYGYYCIAVYDSCYDTTITRCLSILGPQVTNTTSVATSNRTCNTFTATVSGAGLINPTYCLYNSTNVLVSCNTSGIFNGLAYGNYTVSTRNGCPDTTFTLAFSETPPLPSLDATVAQTHKSCNSFTASITGQLNLTNPAYCIYDVNDSMVACNSTGIFSNLAYGSYCIKIKDACFDTTIIRCFSADPAPIDVVVSSRRSCTYGFARMGVTVSGGSMPVNIRVYRPDGTLLINRMYNSTPVNLDSIPGILTSQKYKVLAIDNCGSRDSVSITASASVFSKSALVIARCPSSTWTNGSGTIQSNVKANTGNVSVRIIKRNSANVNIAPSVVSGGIFTFNNLAPARYVLRYTINDACGRVFYDTLTVRPYQYPNLNRSSAYQCDQNGFSIGAVVSNGLGPFSYEIIGSTPATPSLVSPPQTSPIFNINNGTSYSLVRLRTTDLCGNASLQDASILPLANNGITASFNCLQLNSTLSVDTISNATYAWYRKSTLTSTDSTFISSSYSIYLPFVLPADTGYYMCNIKVNNGCINRSYYYHLDGSCSQILPLKLESFAGRFAGTKAVLTWSVTANPDLKRFIVERKNNHGNFYQAGTVELTAGQGGGQYYFIDSLPYQGDNFYRIRLVSNSGNHYTSKEVLVTPLKVTNTILIYPNPVQDQFTVEFNAVQNHQYKLKLLNLMNQVVKEVDYNGASRDRLQIKRTPTMLSGVYFVKIIDLNTNEEMSQKIIFR
ncbi:MAG: hypothetical protein RL172_2741 [Bacteroidota bacterium]